MCRRNSPSYRHSLGRDVHLEGTLSFEEIHPDDKERMRHVFIGLFLNVIRAAGGGGTLGVRTCRRRFTPEDVSKDRPPTSLKVGDELVVAEINVERPNTVGNGSWWWMTSRASPTC